LPTHIAASRAVQLLSKIAVDVQGLVKRESGDLDGKGWRSLDVVEEEGGRDEEKEGFDGVLPFLEAWDTVIPTTRMRHRQRGSIVFYREYAMMNKLSRLAANHLQVCCFSWSRLPQMRNGNAMVSDFRMTGDEKILMMSSW
jgi:hypothetical protein